MVYVCVYERRRRRGKGVSFMGEDIYIYIAIYTIDRA